MLYKFFKYEYLEKKKNYLLLKLLISFRTALLFPLSLFQSRRCSPQLGSGYAYLFTCSMMIMPMMIVLMIIMNMVMLP